MTNALQGRRILVIEDESLVAMLLETILDDMGCAVVGPESNIDDGLVAATTEASLDAALLGATDDAEAELVTVDIGGAGAGALNVICGSATTG